MKLLCEITSHRWTRKGITGHFQGCGRCGAQRVWPPEEGGLPPFREQIREIARQAAREEIRAALTWALNAPPSEDA